MAVNTLAATGLIAGRPVIGIGTVARYTFSPVSLTAGRPVIAVAKLYADPVDLIVSSPVLAAPRLYPLFPFFVGQAQLETDWDFSDPEVWALNKLKVDTTDGEIIKEALFSNHNADLIIECNGQSLVGRSENGRGVAKKIDVVLPLQLQNHQLKIVGDVGGGGGFGEVESPLYVEDEILKLDTDGLIGPVGPQGPIGLLGPQGLTGPQGIQGPQGTTGLQGPTGNTGSQGPLGNTGAPGSVWRDGVGAPLNSLGINGDYYLNHTTGDVYLKSGGSYATVTNARGPQGNTGAQGIQGIQGNVGPQGLKGDQGDTGTQGIQGIQGTVGPQGPIGPTGLTGPQGAPAVATASGFTAYKTADQSIVTDTWTKLVFGSTAYNNGNFFNTGTGRYTPAAGEVCLNASVWCDGVLVGSDIYLAIYKNGTILRFATSNTSNGAAEITCADNASGSDYYEAWVFAYTGGPNYNVRTGNNDINFFQAFQPMGPPGPAGPTAISGVPVPGQVARFINASTIEGFNLVVDPAWTTGDLKTTHKVVADAGWIFWLDGTIGDAASGATRANADTLALFTLYYDNYIAANCPLLTSAGGATTRAAQGTAAAAFAAHCRMSLPKAAGRSLAVAGTGAGLTARTVGATAGSETETQTLAKLVNHAHAGSSTDAIKQYDPNGNWTASGGNGLGTANVYISGSGSNAPLDILDPSTYVNVMIKL